MVSSNVTPIVLMSHAASSDRARSVSDAGLPHEPIWNLHRRAWTSRPARRGSRSNARRPDAWRLVAQDVEEALEHRDRPDRCVAPDGVLAQNEKPADYDGHATNQTQVLKRRAASVPPHPRAAPTCDARFSTRTPSTSIIAAGTIVSATTSWILGAAVAARIRTSSRWAIRIERA